MCTSRNVRYKGVLPSGSEDPGLSKKKGDQMSSRRTSNSGPAAETTRVYTIQCKRVTIDKTSSIAFRCPMAATCTNNNKNKLD